MKRFLFLTGLLMQLAAAVEAADKMTVAYATLGPALSPGWVSLYGLGWGTDVFL